MAFFKRTAVDGGLGPQTLPDGPFHLSSKPENTVHIIAMLDPHLIDLNHHVLQAGQAHKTRVLIIIFPGSRNRRVVQEVSRLSPHAADGGFKLGDPGLEGGQYGCGCHTFGFVEVGQVQVGVGHGVQNHGKIAVNIRGRSAAVVVGVLDVMGPYLQPALGKLNRIFHVRGAGNGAAPDGADRSAHHDARIGAFLDAAFCLRPVVGKGRP